MDKYRVSAQALNKNGDRGVFSILVYERDSEVISSAEKILMLEMAATRRQMILCSEASIEDVTEDRPCV